MTMGIVVWMTADRTWMIRRSMMAAGALMMGARVGATTVVSPKTERFLSGKLREFNLKR
jgi:acyl-coenzyme A synthetase/AMP-(fatty) acid ligase